MRFDAIPKCPRRCRRRRRYWCCCCCCCSRFRRKVGWIFAHPPREEGFLFSSAEVITAATLQLEAADGINDTPFVTVKVSQQGMCPEGACFV